MKKLILGALTALALVLLMAAPAFASSGHRDTHINVWCSADDRTARADINGIVVVGDDAYGTVTLQLLGSKDRNRDFGWEATAQTVTLHLVRGQIAYHFHFDVTLDQSHFLAYKVRLAGDYDDQSRAIDRDECGFRVPEAPASSLLALAGILPVGGWLAVRRFGVKLPLPGLRHLS